jgi:hypothetical protein
LSYDVTEEEECLESDDVGSSAAAHDGEKKGSRRFYREGFILELLAIDGYAARSYTHQRSRWT